MKKKVERQIPRRVNFHEIFPTNNDMIKTRRIKRYRTND